VPDQAVAARVVLAGRANVGKSSLLNTLCNTDRAIVSAMAGTTRDVLSATLSLAGHSCPVTIQDAAGLCAIDDEIAGRADSAARAAVMAADIVLFVFDLNQGLKEADANLLDDVRSMNRSAVILLVGNKCDLVDDEVAVTKTVHEIEKRTSLNARATSAVTITGIDELKTTLVKMLGCPRETADSAVGLHLRQKRLLLSAAGACSRAKDICQASDGISIAAETAAIELRFALSQLGQISGEVLTEDILGNIFERFCVGK
ncbi:MAG TPA: GTP-binding protein, partial [Phycisphaerae bacterium]|nr:GTP-binding protein [Phycisphaerae bacterium]